MKLKLIRTEYDNRTEGDLYIDNILFCKTLEDKVRENKIPHETAIPYGHYQVILSYSPKFHTYLPLIVNVPNFEGIRIHQGNTIQDTSGCILVGEYIKDGYLYNSTVTLHKLLKKLSNEQNIEIEITK